LKLLYYRESSQSETETNTRILVEPMDAPHKITIRGWQIYTKVNTEI